MQEQGNCRRAAGNEVAASRAGRGGVQSRGALGRSQPLWPKGCTDADPRLVRRMKAMVTHRTDEVLNARFGISYNTWRKLIAGQPVRASLLTRLEARLDRLEAQEGA